MDDDGILDRNKFLTNKKGILDRIILIFTTKKNKTKQNKTKQKNKQKIQSIYIGCVNTYDLNTLSKK